MSDSKKQTILIIDDNPGSLSLLENHLHKQGLDILVARDGERGIDKALFALPDLILLDVVMPGIDGFETCRRLKSSETTRNIPVIFMTSLADPEDKVRGFQAGAVDYITKPVQEAETVARVTMHLRLRELNETLEQKVEERTRELENANQQLQKEIAERCRAEKELLENKERLQLITDSLPALIAYVDKNRRYVFANAYYKNIFNADPADIIGRPVEEVLGTKGFNQIKSHYDAVFSGETRHYEVSFHTPGGELRHFRAANRPHVVDGSVQGLFVLVMDITEHKRAQTALEREQHKFSSLVETMPGFFYLQAQDHTIRFANRNFRELFDDPHPEGKICHQVIAKRNTPCEPCPTFRVFETKKPDAWEWVSPDGRIFMIYDHPFHDTDGTFLVLEFGIDITERKRAEQEREKLEVRLRQTHKLEAIGTLAGGIAHDFNNILGIILGNAELATDDVPDWSPASSNLEEIKTACLRARDVVRQLLAFSRKDEAEQKTLDIVPVVRESLKLLRASIPANIEIRQSISPETNPIVADATQFHQIIINLCTNAAHAMEEAGGILEISTENIALNLFSVSSDPGLKPGRYVRLTVSDTGSGIPPELEDKIFDPYFTTKDVGKGSGMGLWVVHGIVRNHGGAISAYSKAGRGTKFEIMFPFAEKGVKAEGHAEEMPLPRGTERILFVDDEESAVKMVSQRLERLGYHVRATTSPGEALELFREHSDLFDLVMTDMEMPEMTGDKLAKEILAIRPDMPLIICTGFSQHMNAEKTRDIGIRRYVEKPLDREYLAKVVRELLDDSMLILPDFVDPN